MNVNQVYFLALKSRYGLIYVTVYSRLYRIFVALCGLRCVCDGFATHAMTWRLFCEDFCRIKFVNMFKTFAESRCMRGLCDSMRTFGDGLKTSSRSDSSEIKAQQFQCMPFSGISLCMRVFFFVWQTYEYNT